jgi:exodeoxyribonuclease-3
VICQEQRPTPQSEHDFENRSTHLRLRAQMRVVAWNCMGGFSRKVTSLAALAPDIAVISEVTKPAFDGISDVSGVWTGRGGAKGLAILGQNGWCIEAIHDSPRRHLLAVRAKRGNEAITVVGVWTLPINRDYVAPIALGLAELTPHLAGEVLIAGDFNANPIFDSKKSVSRQFMGIVHDLATRGIASVWHDRSGEQHGAERTPTFFLNLNEQKPFHIDYVFASVGLRRRVEAIQIGTYTEWTATQRSDHVPISVDFGPRPLAI